LCLTQAADALDAVGDAVFSDLLWVDSEERGLRSVSHKLCECGAADMHRPPLALFRGECGSLQIKMAERTVAFVDSFVKRERGREGGRERGRRRGREGEPARDRGRKERETRREGEAERESGREGGRGREGERKRGGTAASKNQGDRRGGTERVGKWRRNKRE